MCEQAVWNDDTFGVEEEMVTYLPCDQSPIIIDGLLTEEVHSVQEIEHHNSPVSNIAISGPLKRPTKDISDANAIKGICGLNNLGNTCFMNAGLQCLFNNAPLCQFMLDKYEKDDSSMTRKFLDLIIKVWSGSYSVVNPDDFKKILGLYHHQFQDNRQHDCQEFLALLLDTLHEQLNTASNNSEVSTGHGSQSEASDGKVDEAMDTGYSSTKKNEDMIVDSLSAIDESCESAASSEESVDINKYHLKPTCEFISSKEVITSKSTSNTHELQHHGISEKSSPMIVENCNNLQWPHKTMENKSGSKENCYASCSPPFSKLPNVNFKHNDHITGERKLEKNELASKINAGLILPCIEDFYKKDSKTLNTNVLVTEFSQTNIKYDSEKFTKIDNINRPNEHLQSLENLHHFDAISSPKHPLKETNLLTERKGKLSDWNGEIDGFRSCYSINNIKRMKIDEKQKNVNVEADSTKKSVRRDKSNNIVEKSDDYQVKPRSTPDSGISISCDQELPLERQCAADIEWEKYLSKNQSIVVDTFQGQFKSTVVCSECNHVSVTFEPFMYLSIPLPRAMERQISVTFVPCDNRRPVRYLVSLNIKDNIRKLKQELKTLIGLDQTCDILVAEVLESRVSRTLDDNIFLRCVNDTNRTIYAFEMLPAILPEEKTENSSLLDETSIDMDDYSKNDFSLFETHYPLSSCSSNPVEKPMKNQWHSCAICLEEMADVYLWIHQSCGCTLCGGCIDMSCKHKGGDKIPCPVCLIVVERLVDFVPLNQTANYKPKTRILSVPIVFRLDYEENNKIKNILFGHPNILYLPSKITGQLLFQSVDRIVPALSSSYSIVLTTSQGIHCARCSLNAKCSGCELIKDVLIHLQPGDNLAIKFTNISRDQMSPCDYIDDKSMETLYHNEPLTIYECLKAFTQSELLDEQNPWYCPRCKKNQCALKTLKVWRYPLTLIVYLKRFVFHELSSTKLDNKVIFPLEKLDLSTFLEGPQENSELIYDLQSCVCHFGGVNSGHYTAYSKHIISGDWYHYNDNETNKQSPNNTDYSSAYILFYQRSGISCELNFPDKFELDDEVDNATGSERFAQENLDFTEASSGLESATLKDKFDFYS